MSVAKQRDYFRTREVAARTCAERAASPAAAAHRTMADAYRERLRSLDAAN